MQRFQLLRIVAAVLFAFGLSEGHAMAQGRSREAPTASSHVTRPFSLTRATAYNNDLGLRGSGSSWLQSENAETVTVSTKAHDYREISDFFNVREANVNTLPGEWELELEGGWETGANGDDDFSFTPNIKYGINEDMFVELEVRPLLIGDGGDQGNGDTSLQWFYQIARETDTLPAFATWAEARFPTGDGSSKLDGEVHFNMTKTLMPDVRGHLEGFLESANGGRGDDGDNRRAFQWGAGVGFDYQIDELTICTLNYLNRTNDEYGNSNAQILEVGGVRQIAEDQHLKLALDIDLDGRDEGTPDFGVNVLWSIEW